MKRVILIAATLITVASPLAASAREYPWCARTSSNGFAGDCSFTSYRQCQATVSGQAGECLINPRVAGQQDHAGHMSYQR